MNEPLALCAAQKFQLLEILYMRLPYGRQTDAKQRVHAARGRPGTKAVLYLLADCPAALRWSNARIAEHIGYSLRTVARAMVELREAGILTSFRKARRSIAQKYLNVSNTAALVALTRQKAQRNCTIAVGFLRRGLEVPREALSNLWVSKEPQKVVAKPEKQISVKVESEHSASLEAALDRFETLFRARTEQITA